MGGKVFISYSHDSEEHCRRVEALAARLRAEGVDCTIDSHETSPPEGWINWMERRIAESDYVLAVCTESYCRRARAEEASGVGQGAVYEAGLMIQELYASGLRNKKYIPVQFEKYLPDEIPPALRTATHYILDREYDALYRHLTGQPRVVRGPVGPPRVLPSGQANGSPAKPEPRPVTPARGVPSLRALVLGLLAVALLTLSGFMWRVRSGPGEPFQENLEKGRSALRVLDPRAAVAWLDRALSYNDFPQAHSARAEALAMQGKIADAAREVEAAERWWLWALPEIERKRVAAPVAFLRGDWKTARDQFRELFRLLPTDPDAAVGYAEAELELEGSGPALEAIRRIKETCTDPRLDLVAAKAWFFLSRYKEQKDAATPVFERFAKEQPLLAARGGYLRGIALIKSGDIGDGVTDLEIASGLSVDNPAVTADIQDAMGNALFEEGKYRQASGAFEVAYKSYDQIGDAGGTADESQNLATVQYKLGELDQAKSTYLKLLAELGDAGDGRNRTKRATLKGNLGLVLERRGYLTEARRYLIEAAEDLTGPESDNDLEQQANQQCTLALVAIQQLWLAEAKGHLLACRLRAEGFSASEAEAQLRQGVWLFLLGKLEEARPLLEEALKRRPSVSPADATAESLLALAELLLETGDSKSALLARQHAAEAAQLSGEDNPDWLAKAQVTQARALLALGKGKEALFILREAQKRAAATEELELRVQFRLAAAQWCEDSGDFAGARSLIRAAEADAAQGHPLLASNSALAAGALELMHGDGSRGREQLNRLRNEAVAQSHGLAVARIDRILGSAPP